MVNSRRSSFSKSGPGSTGSDADTECEVDHRTKTVMSLAAAQADAAAQAAALALEAAEEAAYAAEVAKAGGRELEGSHRITSPLTPNGSMASSSFFSVSSPQPRWSRVQSASAAMGSVAVIRSTGIGERGGKGSKRSSRRGRGSLGGPDGSISRDNYTRSSTSAIQTGDQGEQGGRRKLLAEIPVSTLPDVASSALTRDSPEDSAAGAKVKDGNGGYVDDSAVTKGTSADGTPKAGEQNKREDEPETAHPHSRPAAASTPKRRNGTPVSAALRANVSSASPCSIAAYLRVLK